MPQAGGDQTPYLLYSSTATPYPWRPPGLPTCGGLKSVDRKTIRRYERYAYSPGVATGSDAGGSG